MHPAQKAALTAALEALGEHFETVVILAQPDPRLPEIECAYTGSWHAVSSICETAQMQFALAEPTPPDSDEERAAFDD